MNLGDVLSAYLRLIYGISATRIPSIENATSIQVSEKAHISNGSNSDRTTYFNDVVTQLVVNQTFPTTETPYNHSKIEEIEKDLNITEKGTATTGLISLEDSYEKRIVMSFTTPLRSIKIINSTSHASGESIPVPVPEMKRFTNVQALGIFIGMLLLVSLLIIGGSIFCSDKSTDEEKKPLLDLAANPKDRPKKPKMSSHDAAYMLLTI